jgi:hypothetical protein
MINDNIKLAFLKVLNQEIALHEFEQWIYKSKELENNLATDDYHSLIAFNFKDKNAEPNLNNLLKTLINMGEFETYKLRKLITEARLRNENLLRILVKFYDLYCHGYVFLDSIGLGLGLNIQYMHTGYYTGEWVELSPAEDKKMIDSITPLMEAELNRIQRWLDNEEIVLTGEQNELEHYQFIDKRNEEEKVSLIVFPQYMHPLDSSKKRWWELWK